LKKETNYEVVKSLTVDLPTNNYNSALFSLNNTPHGLEEQNPKYLYLLFINITET